MKDKSSNSKNNSNDDEKIHVSQSVFQTAKEMQDKRAAEEELQQKLLQEKIAEHEKKKREAYERRLLEEKKELLRMKQDSNAESELIHEEAPETVKLSLLKKIGNFFYHSKWWLGIGVFFVFLAAFLIYDLVSKERPDIVVLVIADNESIGYSSELPKYIESFSEDFNNNNEVLASIYYIPYSDSYQSNYANGVDNKLTVEFQSAEAMIVIGNEKTSEILEADSAFINLEELYPNNPNVDGTAYYLKNSNFADVLGLNSDAVTDDVFISFRKPQKLLYTDEEEMQETYDKDFPVFDKIINDLSK